MDQKKIRITTLGVPLANPKEFPYGCPILKALHWGYQHPFDQVIHNCVELKEDPKEAELALVPSNLHSYSKRQLGEIERKIREAQLPSLAFDLQNQTKKPDWLDFVIRFGWYKTLESQGDITAPAILPGSEIPGNPTLLEKSEKPTIGFCGCEGSQWGQKIANLLGNPTIAYMAKSRVFSTWGHTGRLCNHPIRVQAIKILSRDPGIHCHFIGRGRNWNLPKDTKEEQRKEFVENMRDNLYSLCVRGNENYSWRTFEAISQGRIPVLIETNGTLPLQNEIDWKELIIQVDCRRLRNLPTILKTVHENHSNQQILDWQKRLIETWEKKLRPEVFYPKLLTEILRKRN